MVMLLLIPAVAQVALPLALLAWSWRAAPSRVEQGLKLLAVGGYLVGIAGGRRAVAGPALVALPGLSRAVRGPGRLRLRAGRAEPPAVVAASGGDRGGRNRAAPFLRAGAMAALAVVMVGLAAYALSGRLRPEGEVASLTFPLQGGGTYYVANGGGNGLVNAHREALRAERLRPWRGEAHALDIVALDRWGLRASGILPDDPSRYAIFGDPVHAPCDGRVIRVVDGLPDLPPPRTDRGHPAGNHVLLGCGDDLWVLLAHLQRGSVRAVEGGRVRVGAMVGRVGNSGNTDEPHLHIHAQRPGTPEAPLGGDPVPALFDGEYLVRNDRISGRG